MVAVAVRLLLLACCSNAVQKFDMRSKIGVDGTPEDNIETEIKEEVRKLFCEELQPVGMMKCSVAILSTDLSPQDNNNFIGEVQFKVSLEMLDGTSKSDLKTDLEDKINSLDDGSSDDEGSTESSGEGSGESSGEQSGDDESATLQNIMLDVLEPLVGFEFFTITDEQTPYNLIDTSSLSYHSIVVCVGECKEEGFWMMIAFVSTAGFCLVTGGLSCLGSRRIRQGSSVFNSLLLLGLIGGMVYVGVVEKVNWKITGGCVGMLVLVNLIGCCSNKKSEKKVNNDEIEEYWEDLAKRDAHAETKLE